MAPRVVPDQVPLRRNPPHQLRLRLRPAPQHEKRRLHAVLAQHIQQPRRPLRIGPVVKRQRHLARPLRRNQRRPKHPRPRPHRRISIPSRRQPGRPNRAKPLVHPRCQSRNRHPLQCAALAPSPATAFYRTRSAPRCSPRRISPRFTGCHETSLKHAVIKGTASAGRNPVEKLARGFVTAFSARGERKPQFLWSPVGTAPIICPSICR